MRHFYHRHLLLALLFGSLVGCSDPPPPAPSPNTDFCASIRKDNSTSLEAEVRPWREKMQDQTGVYPLEDGNAALLARAWLSEYAEKTIDVQYFIFSADNVGLIASDYLLRAAKRGVAVRVLVDDLMVDADLDNLLALDSHPHFQIKIYNPNINLGKNIADKLMNVTTDFWGVNQRMHNKTFIADGMVSITGGRNVADEYFDYDHDYNFRDRDVLMLGGESAAVQKSFNQFWNHPLAVSLTEVTEKRLTPAEANAAKEALHQYACNPANFWPEIREAIVKLPTSFKEIQQSPHFQWVEKVRFISDHPNKNEAGPGSANNLSHTQRELMRLVQDAQESVYIQTPYLVMTEVGRRLLADAVKRGVRVVIQTNSLASTDNLMAFGGYARDREAILATGVQIYEWRPDAKIRQKLMRTPLAEKNQKPPVFGLHAKTMVVDQKIAVIGTFNFDPRSAYLNTECITIIPSASVASAIQNRILAEITEDNSWHTTPSKNPDAEAGIMKRLRLLWQGLAPKILL